MTLPTPDTASYLSAKPFPHGVVDGVFSPTQLRLLLIDWPVAHEQYSDSGNEKLKGGIFSEALIEPSIANFIKINFQSQRFIYWLEQLTGITGLVFDCRKFALHETFPGGSLAPHLDYTISKVTGLQLRVNVILYLNENWKPEYGGNLELYESRPYRNYTQTKSVVSISPIFNRMVIFTMDAGAPAWHGNPEPLRCPEGISRRSIALNYFSIPHKNAVAERTVFSSERLKLRDFVPPIVYKLFTHNKTRRRI